MYKIIFLVMLMSNFVFADASAQVSVNKAQAIAIKEADKYKIKAVDETIYYIDKPISFEFVLNDCVDDIYEKNWKKKIDPKDKSKTGAIKETIRKKICEPQFSDFEALRGKKKYWYFEINGRKNNEPNRRGAKILIVFIEVDSLKVYSNVIYER